MEYQSNVLHIGGIPATELASRFARRSTSTTPPCCGGRSRMSGRLFTALPFQPFYAMKANSNVCCCGSSASRLRVRCGLAGRDPSGHACRLHAEAIWFTCSNVSDDDLRAIPDPRVVINVNSVVEIDRIVALGLTNPIALRVNPPVGAGHHRDVITAGESVKFGIDVAEIATARMLVEDSGRRVVGLHAHIGSARHDGAAARFRALLLEWRLCQVPALDQLRRRHLHTLSPRRSRVPIQRYGAEMTELAGPLRASAASRPSSSRDAISSPNRACAGARDKQAVTRASNGPASTPASIISSARRSTALTPHRQRLPRTNGSLRTSWDPASIAMTWSWPATSANRATSSPAPTAASNPPARTHARRRSPRLLRRRRLRLLHGLALHARLLPRKSSSPREQNDPHPAGDGGVGRGWSERMNQSQSLTVSQSQSSWQRHL